MRIDSFDATTMLFMFLFGMVAGGALGVILTPMGCQ